MNLGPRPKTTRDLPAGWRRTILSLARQGLPEKDVRKQLGLSVNGWYGLLRRDAKFREAVQAARQARLSRRLGVAV